MNQKRISTTLIILGLASICNSTIQCMDNQGKVITNKEFYGKKTIEELQFECSKIKKAIEKVNIDYTSNYPISFDGSGIHFYSDDEMKRVQFLSKYLYNIKKIIKEKKIEIEKIEIKENIELEHAISTLRKNNIFVKTQNPLEDKSFFSSMWNKTKKTFKKNIPSFNFGFKDLSKKNDD